MLKARFADDAGDENEISQIGEEEFNITSFGDEEFGEGATSKDFDRSEDSEKLANKKKRLSTRVSLLFSLDEKPDGILSGSDESLEELMPAGSFVFRKKLPYVPDFFDVLGTVPDIDELSLDESLQKIAKATKTDEGEEFEEGDILELPIDEEQEKESSEELRKVEEEQVAESSSLTEYSEFEFVPSEQEEEGEKEPSDEHLFDTFIEVEKKEVFIEPTFDFEAWARKESERQVKEDTATFLKCLIDYVVERSEYIDPNEVLRENLDRVKLFHKLCKSLQELHVERKVNDFLDRKCVDFYRRQKMYRPITPDPADVLEDEKEKNKNICNHLDHLLGRESESKEIVNKSVAELEKDIARIKEEANSEVTLLEQYIRKTFSRRATERIMSLVDKSLKNMAAVRREISEVRFVLIQRQHTTARLTEKAEKLENLGPGLQLRDFERMENEAYGLSKKLEERTVELNKIRSRYNAHTHISAHTREKQNMMILSLRIQVDALKEAQSEKYFLRSRIHNMKINRIRVQKEIRDLSFKNGLIDKPALMIEYDETEDKVKTMKVKVDKMKKDLARIERRIARIEKSCNQE